jgi:16S rRNA (cytosine967-C5)-methyltransferase
MPAVRSAASGKSSLTPAQVRANAARGVEAVAKYNRTIDWVFENRPQWVASAESRALLYGTVRHYHSLQALVTGYLDKALRDKDLDIHCLLLVGAYQLKHSNKPVHAVINETVGAVNRLRKPWAKGLTNAILRRLADDQDALHAPDQSFDHPDWLVNALQADYPLHWQDIVAANNTQAPMVLRVNLIKNSREAYMTSLQDAGIAHYPGAGQQAVVLEQAMTSELLPGWEDGAVAVQDMGAQYAAQLLHDHTVVRPSPTNSSAGQQHSLRFLDACAAPGGKLSHWLELMTARPHIAGAHEQALAIDISEHRIAATHSILRRLGHRVDIQQADACGREWWDGQTFDAILMDAPCSGTGTIRRHPDIKLLLSEQAVHAHHETQWLMLNNLWQTLASGGTLLYCTCSLLQLENDRVISRFLESNNNHANVLQFELPSGMATRHGWQLLPTDRDTDGFYYALLRKQ